MCCNQNVTDTFVFSPCNQWAQNVTPDCKKSAFSSFFTTKPFCRTPDAPGPGGSFLFNMPKLQYPCNILSIHVIYSMRAIKRKNGCGGVKLYLLTLYIAFICPLCGFWGLCSVSPYPPPPKACTRSTAAFLTVSAPIIIFFFIANHS